MIVNASICPNTMCNFFQHTHTLHDIPPTKKWGLVSCDCARLDAKANGTKVLVPIRPIGITAGVMDIDNVVVRMV